MKRKFRRSAAWCVLLCFALPSLASARSNFAAANSRKQNPLPSVDSRAGVWPRREVLDLALRAYRCGRAAGHFESSILTVIDYSLPSTEPRLWVVDLAARRVLFHELVAHGQNSGAVYPNAFSNRRDSRQSSLGLFRTDDVYTGQHGESLRLTGLEPGINDRAAERRIVMHGADYVSSRVIERFGKLGRSWGCPALDRAVIPQIIPRIKEGTALFVYYPDPAWIAQSSYLQCSAAAAADDPLLPDAG